MSVAADLSPVYLVKGSDAVLVDQAVHALIRDLVGTGDASLMVEEFGGPSAEPLDVGSVIDACTTPSFLVERRIVVLRDVGQVPKDDVKRLVAYLEDPLPSTVLVLSVGGGTLSTTLSKAVGASGAVIDTSVGTGKARSQWFAEHIKEGPVRLQPQAAQRLTEHLGGDVGRLTGLLDTLAAAYGPGHLVTSEELEPFLGEAGGLAPWDLTDAIDAGKIPDALVVLHRMLAAGETHPLVILTQLHRHYRQMLRLDGTNCTSEQQTADLLGIKPFPARKALNGARRLGGEGLGRAIALLAAADLDLRGMTGLDGPMVLEVLVARLAQLARLKR